MAKNLMEKSQRIQVPEPRSASTAPPPPSKPKTAPGTLMGFMEGQSTVHQEDKALRERAEEAQGAAEEFKGATPVRILDPKLIRRSDWANRNPASFDGTSW